MSEGPPADEPLLPEQTSDDVADPADRESDDPDDLERFLRDVPPHHGD
ncbi:MAG TPA: hypothetical protein VMT88_08840 [Actinomycetes bacterium]|nr:hypothetical protein [Actinomycetes bacterium]